MAVYDSERSKDVIINDHVLLEAEESSRMSSGKQTLPLHGEEAKVIKMPLIWYFALAFMVLVYGSYGVLMNLSKLNGRIPFSSSALNFLIETVKFLVAATLLTFESAGEKTWTWPVWRQALPFAVPAVLYSINNNLSVLMQVHMDPATYQVLGNLKIVTTAVLYRLILKRPLRVQQWISVVLLTMAGVCDSTDRFAEDETTSAINSLVAGWQCLVCSIMKQRCSRDYHLLSKSGFWLIRTKAQLYSSYGSLVEQSDVDIKSQHITVTGLVIILTYCFISALAGVYTEFILKKDLQTSLHLQNMMLYSFSITLNFIGWFITQIYSDPAENDPPFQLLKGFTFYAWLIIFTQAFNGLGMSVVFKHGSNLVRLFVISCAMIVSTTLSIFMLGVALNILYFVTVFLVIVAIYLYYN